MLYRKAPKTGDELSILGFGCMRLPQKDGRIDEERATRQVRHAIDRGVNYIDTAWPYHAGQSEPFVGRVLRDGYRERVKLATKLPSWLVKNRSDMDRFLDAQLKKLETSRIDYYLVHSMSGENWERIAEQGVTDFLEQAKADGRIVNAGFSYHGTRTDFKPVVDGYDWDFCQIQYSFLDEEQQAGTEGLRYAAEKGLAVIVMEPLRGGLLAAVPQPAEIEAIWREADGKRNPAEWALRWVWNHPQATVVLSGMNNEAQVEENLRIAGEARPDSLSPAELELVAKAARKYQEMMKIGCTGCGYCQPCPSGVNISNAFEVYNLFHTFGKQQDAMFLYVLRLGGIVSGEPGYASQCARCSDCLEKCPQSLPIPDLLEDVAAQFETANLKEREAVVKRLFLN